MTNAERIEKYINNFSRSLPALPQTDRTSIIEEIRSHLTYRDSEGRLEEALSALGSPQQCARGFLEEVKLQEAFADGSPTKTFGALFALASRRITAAIGLFFSGFFFLLAVGFAITAIAEIVAPSLAGLWVSPDKNMVAFGILEFEERAQATELLGRWMIPVGTGLSVASFLVGQWLGGFFLKLMLNKRNLTSV